MTAQEKKERKNERAGSGLCGTRSERTSLSIMGLAIHSEIRWLTEFQGRIQLGPTSPSFTNLEGDREDQMILGGFCGPLAMFFSGSPTPSTSDQSFLGQKRQGLTWNFSTGVGTPTARGFDWRWLATSVQFVLIPGAPITADPGALRGLPNGSRLWNNN